jgi:CRISPR-associated protein Cpf1
VLDFYIFVLVKNDTMKIFTKIYPLSKTLRFELKPIGKTLEHIESSGILTQD